VLALVLQPNTGPDKHVLVANLNKLDYDYEDLAKLIRYSAEKKSESLLTRA
jgi:hypothetical protein